MSIAEIANLQQPTRRFLQPDATVASALAKYIAPDYLDSVATESNTGTLMSQAYRTRFLEKASFVWKAAGYSAVVVALTRDTLTGAAVEQGTNVEESGIYVNQESVVSRFLKSVVDLSTASRIREGMELVFSTIEDWLSRNRYDWCSKALHQVDTKLLQEDIVFSFVTITRVVKDNLPDRQAFMLNAVDRIGQVKGRDYAERLLKKYF